MALASALASDAAPFRHEGFCGIGAEFIEVIASRKP